MKFDYYKAKKLEVQIVACPPMLRSLVILCNAVPVTSENKKGEWGI